MVISQVFCKILGNVIPPGSLKQAFSGGGNVDPFDPLMEYPGNLVVPSSVFP